MWDKWLLVRCAKLLQAKYKVKQKKTCEGVEQQNTRKREW